MTALLEVRDVVRTFGGIRATDSVSFDVEHGEVLGIIGPNGAGKTVLLNLINGVYAIEQGSIALNSERIDGLLPHQIAAKGIARTFQSTEQFKEFRVIDYVMLGRFAHQYRSHFAAALSLPGVSRSERDERRRAAATLERVGLARYSDERLSELAYGVQKQVDIARAMATEPTLMLLDEPTSGTTSAERSAIATVLTQMQDSETTVVIVDHDVRFLSAQCERLVALNYGRKIAEGTPAQVLRTPEVLASYLGDAGRDAPDIGSPADHSPDITG